MTTAERGGLSPHRAGLLAERGELRLQRAVERRSGQATRQIGLELRMLGDRAALDSLAQHRRHRDIGDAEIAGQPGPVAQRFRSEEHTSELQSLMRSSYAVFRLKQKNHTTTVPTHPTQ